MTRVQLKEAIGAMAFRAVTQFAEGDWNGDAKIRLSYRLIRVRGRNAVTGAEIVHSVRGAIRVSVPPEAVQ